MPNPSHKTTSAPLIETARLRLRAHQLADFESCVAMWSDPIVTQYIGGKPSTRPQTWGRVLTYIGHWSVMGYGFWAVEEKETGGFIGELGFAQFKREMEPSFGDFPEIGWAIVSSAHGKGYASEALKEVMSWGDTNLKMKRTVCMINPENAASLKIAAKLGYREFTRTNYLERPVILFERVI